MMWTRNLRTSYFIIWMFPAPSKPCMQTQLGLENFPCVYTTGPNWMQQISPDAGRTLQYDVRRVCDQPQNTLLQGFTLHKQQEDGLLLASLLIAIWWVGFFFLKRCGSFLVCRLLDPHPPHLGEEGVRDKIKTTTMISPEGTSFQPFSLCQRWYWHWGWNSTSVSSHTSQCRTGQTRKDA